MAYASAFVAGVGFFILSVSFLGVWPAKVLEQQAREFGPETTLALTASEQRGRDIYAREGCSYCHTQQVRFTAADQARFGAPTMAWEGRRDFPHMLGTRRIGPDLSRATGTRSADWHLVHLFDPRAVVPESVMPSYAHLFGGSASAPTQAARDVVAYLESLGRARVLAGPESASELSASAVTTRWTGRVPDIPANGDSAAGASLYQRLCAGCHGAEGRGDGSAAAALSPRPPNLTGAYTQARLAEVLWHGVPGTSMSAWRDRPMAELSALITHVQSLGPSSDEARRLPAVTPEQQRDAPGLYAANCAQCHGERGAGDGWAAPQLTTPPTNFRQQRGHRVSDAIRHGIEGTMMAAWSTRLSSDEIDALIWYLATLYEGHQ